MKIIKIIPTLLLAFVLCTTGQPCNNCGDFFIMKEIKLTKGKIAIVDDEDFEWISQFRWHYMNAGYAARREWNKNDKTSTIVLMHRKILNTPVGMDTDHINGNRLDNRKINLRICTRSQNNLNKIREKRNKSGYKGVVWIPEKKLWKVHVAGRYVGKFKNIIDAAMAYDKKAKEIFGEFAKTNF